eukprot:CAMPEP_0118652514 /NCGR_PEP_ID=MMETSP0785-20121206/11358_1 /TAXON_ID=91992 /ORGANISM="Bolidomonas pacifica, Strain CCMP 1866" /LENGTH=404 /DNA_ID=CAMNT_0006545035 /DNA_START=73 /DNA_END=1287 /DNA_ORIENTATION=+
MPTFTSASNNAVQVKKSSSQNSLGSLGLQDTDFDLLNAYLEDAGESDIPSALPSSGASSTGSGEGDEVPQNTDFGGMWDFAAPLMPPEPVKEEIQPKRAVGTRTSSRRINPPTSYSTSTTSDTSMMTTMTTTKGRGRGAGKKRKNSKDSDGTRTATKTKSQAQVDRRRERNRILARRTRLRKKFFFENLQAEVANLKGQNVRLKEIVAQKLPKSIADSVLKECQMELPQCVLEDHSIGSSAYTTEDTKFAASLRTSQACFCISDPSLPDCPIVYASPGFCEVTGYDMAEALGRNCRFLQGPGTSLEKVGQLRESIRNGQDVSVTLLNYRKDGTPFWNSLFVASLMDTSGNVVNHIGVVTEVQGPPPGDPEFEKAQQQQQETGKQDDELLEDAHPLMANVDDDFL